MAEANSVLSASARRVRQHYHRAVRTGMSEQLVLLVVVTLLMAAAIVAVPDYAPLILMVLPMAVASLVLGPRQLPWFIVFVLLTLAVTVTQQPDITVRVAVTVAVLFMLGFIVLLASFRRSNLGVAGVMGESMLVDLRDRILKQGAIPALPRAVERGLGSSARPGGPPSPATSWWPAARGTGSSWRWSTSPARARTPAPGRCCSPGPSVGCSERCRRPQFLPAANDYLLRQEWEEGFATAIHLSLDLTSGRFELRSAGHPPAAVHDAGTGRWGVVVADGPLLGMIEDATYPATAGGDAAR